MLLILHSEAYYLHGYDIISHTQLHAVLRGVYAVIHTVRIDARYTYLCLVKVIII